MDEFSKEEGSENRQSKAKNFVTKSDFWGSRMNRNQESLESSRGALVRAGTSWRWREESLSGKAVQAALSPVSMQKTPLTGPSFSRDRGQQREHGPCREEVGETQGEAACGKPGLKGRKRTRAWFDWVKKTLRLWEGSEEVLQSLRKKDTEVLQGMDRCDHKINLKSYFAKEHRFLLGYQLVLTRTVFWQPSAYHKHKSVEIAQLTNTIWVSAEKQDRAGRTGFTRRSQFTRFSACNR